MTFWRGRSVLVTGHTGFKGTWLCAWLAGAGANVHGFALDPPTVPSMFEETNLSDSLASDTRADLRDAEALDRTFQRARPSIVFHLAAQSLVRRSFTRPVETIDTNVTGTARVLDAVCRFADVQAVVVVTSDKVYSDGGRNHAHSESDQLGGTDPYSASKAAAELIVDAYRHGVMKACGSPTRIATARAGNVIGGGDWAEDRLLPDCIRAFRGRSPVVLRSPGAVRPWQHVLDPLAGYLLVAERLAGEDGRGYCTAWNFGPAPADEARVGAIARTAAALWGDGAVVHGGEPADRSLPERHTLRIDSTRAIQKLGWAPRWSLHDALTHTIAWYMEWHRGGDVRTLTARQIADYEAHPHVTMA